MYDVVIIGAGVVGALAARAFSRYQLKICLLEKANDVAAGGATKANSAIVHAGFDAAEGSMKAEMNVRGCAMMPQVCEELGVKYRNNGSLVVAYSEEDRKALETLKSRGVKNGVPGLVILEKEELLRREPHLSDKILCALYAPTAGIVCPYGLAIAAAGNAMDNGAELRTDFEVTELCRTENGWRVTGLHRTEPEGRTGLRENGRKQAAPAETAAEADAETETVEARVVINAAGLYSDTIARMAGDESFSVRPRRGEYILLDREVGGLINATVFRAPDKMGKGILVTPTVDGNLLAGPTSEDIRDKEDSATTAEGLSRVIGETLNKLNTNVFRSAITSFCGLRAVGSTGDFILTNPFPGFLNAAGIESPGLTSSPAIAEYLVEKAAANGLPLIPKEDFDPLRKPAHAFREADCEEKNRMIREDPAYGRIVCRCEGISEGEILDALRRNPPARDMDGIKRRTRAQMGRCQGGFCSPRVAELLARETGVPVEKVTKSGGRSFLAAGRTKED